MKEFCTVGHSYADLMALTEPQAAALAVMGENVAEWVRGSNRRGPKTVVSNAAFRLVTMGLAETSVRDEGGWYASEFTITDRGIRALESNQ